MAETRGGHWRRMARPDLGTVERIGEAIHPNYPEDPAVIAERLMLYPEGCLVLEVDRAIQGYAVSHPWVFGHPPSLNTQLRRLPPQPDTFYIHDLALMPDVRGGGLGAKAIECLLHLAKREGFNNVSLVALSPSIKFWRKHGFHIVEQKTTKADLSSYGGDAAFMVRSLLGAGLPDDGAATRCSGIGRS